MILDIISSYEAVLIDAYGVLVDAKGPLPNAKTFVEELVTAKTNFLIVTNDASRSHEEIAQRFLRMEMKIHPDQILCSGSLIVDYFKEHELQGAKTQIMGTQASVDFAKSAGANVNAPVELLYANEPLPDAAPVETEIAFLASASVYVEPAFVFSIVIGLGIMVVYLTLEGILQGNRKFKYISMG